MASKVSFIIQLKDQFGRVAEKVKRQFDGMKRASDKAGRSIVDFGRRAQKALDQVKRKAAATGAILTATVTTPIALLGREMIKAASDATETANKFDQVFDDVRMKANQVATDFAKNFGVASSTAKELIGDTGDLLVGFGFTGDAALELSRKVNELAADLTSFQDVEGGVSRASEALTKALLGETESAKSLGIVIRQNTKDFRKQVKAVMRTQRITEQQAKAIVILDQATRQSTKAIGDTARTWENYASVVRRNQEATKELSESFGRLMIPFATKLTKELNKLVKFVDDLSPTMKKVVIGFAAFVALGGPLLLLVAGIAAAFAFVSAKVLLVTSGIVALGAAIIAVAVNWRRIVSAMKRKWEDFKNSIFGIGEKIKEKFTEIWADIKAGLIDFVNVGISWINRLLAPLSEVSEAIGAGKLQIGAISAPTAPTQSISGTVNGEIVVSATPGSQVEKTKSSASSKVLDIGINMAPAL